MFHPGPLRLCPSVRSTDVVGVSDDLKPKLANYNKRNDIQFDASVALA